LLLVVVTIDQHTYFAMVAPLTDVLLGLTTDDVRNFSVSHALGLEFVYPFGQLVRVT
jgi:hypothetical protein